MLKARTLHGRTFQQRQLQREAESVRFAKVTAPTVLDALTAEERSVMTELYGVSRITVTPVDIVALALSMPPHRVTDIEQTALRKLRELGNV